MKKGLTPITILLWSLTSVSSTGRSGIPSSSFMQVSNTVVWAEQSGDLTKAFTDGKRIIVTTIEKFLYIVPRIGAAHKENLFAIIIDEAYFWQSGCNSAQMNLALSGLASDD